jgi:hypothetical protein
MKKLTFEEGKKITKEQMDIFNGLMISDAHLTKKNGKNGNSRFSLITSVKEFRDKVFDIFPNFPWSDSSLTSREVYDKRTNKRYKSHRLRSLTTTFFTEQRKKWYPKGKKIVPKDIKINKDMLLWWYIGDGHLHKNINRPNARRIELATEGFTLKEIKNLILQLKKTLNSESICEERNEIIISKDAITKFAYLLGTISPVPTYQYKFDFGQYLDPDYFIKVQNKNKRYLKQKGKKYAK